MLKINNLTFEETESVKINIDKMTEKSSYSLDECLVIEENNNLFSYYDPISQEIIKYPDIINKLIIEAKSLNIKKIKYYRKITDKSLISDIYEVDLKNLKMKQIFFPKNVNNKINIFSQSKKEINNNYNYNLYRILDENLNKLFKNNKEEFNNEIQIIENKKDNSYKENNINRPFILIEGFKENIDKIYQILEDFLKKKRINHILKIPKKKLNINYKIFLEELCLKNNIDYKINYKDDLTFINLYGNKKTINIYQK